jgi:phosphatidylserine/phosphatidylglycerophosphate/cardiolipin synthase-like enzyme
MRYLAAALALAVCADAHAQYATVRFSPGGSLDLLVSTIKSAKREIDVAAYEFTSTTVADALIAAHERGVIVRVVADAKGNKGKGYSKIYSLANHGVSVRLDAHYAIMHNKILVIDDATVQTGSYNYTRAAEVRNAENVVVIHDAKLAGEYENITTVPLLPI